MKRIIIPEVAEADVAFYLSVEEWAACHLSPGEYFFAWQVGPSIICGRNQDIETEVNLKKAHEKGIKVWRRKSGGGAVLADMNNVMFSYIAPSEAVQTGFSNYTQMICSMLASMGINAKPTGRNDIAIDGRKVAGNSFLRLHGRSIIHGTMLIDTDFNLMKDILTPSVAKQKSKGVVSVPSRVTTLRQEGLTLSCHEFIKNAVDHLCPESNGHITLSENDLKEIMKIRESYLNKDFLYHKKNNRLIISHSKYIEGVGELRFCYSVNASGKINHSELVGDFFPLKDIDAHICSKFIGCKPTEDSLRQAISDINLSDIIAGLTPEVLLSVICATK